MTTPTPSTLLRKRPASEALAIMTYVALQFGLNMSNPKHWKIIYRIINNSVKKN